MCPGLLFRGRGNLNEILSEKKRILEKEIENLKKDYVMKVSEDDLTRHLVSKYALETPFIHEDEICAFDPADTQIEISRGAPSDFGLNRSICMKGTRITVAVPFEGDEDLFHVQPSTSAVHPPKGEVVNQELHLVYEAIDQDREKLNRALRHDLAEITKHLEWVRNQVNSYNKQLEPLVKERIAARKKKLMDDMGLVASLGIPIRRREDSPTTYTIPSIRKKPAISMPIVSNEPFELEPVLSEEEYENILEIVHDMALMMERSPRTFSKLSEEEIRDHFLMVLNSQYGGQATGETFNFGGKTDILIREKGKNVFIAECKFWRGEKSLLETLDQLLGYVSWRDTKVAILLFNQNQDFSSVLNKIAPTIRSHGCWKRQHKLKNPKLDSETAFSYIFHQPSDTNREMVLVVMVFNVPR